jgi:hypothetical protein
MAAAACYPVSNKWTEYSTLEDARQHVEKCQRQKFSSDKDNNPLIAQLGRHSPCWVVTGGKYPGVYSSHDIAMEAARQLECSVHRFADYQLALNCLCTHQDGLPESGTTRSTGNPRDFNTGIDKLLVPGKICAHQHCNRPTRSTLNAGETWSFRPNSYSFCSQEQSRRLKQKKKPTPKTKSSSVFIAWYTAVPVNWK